MDSAQVVDVTREAVITAAVLLAPVLLTALVVGCLTSLLQTITQIQDQALSFVPKLLGIGVVLLLLMPWMTEYFVEYARELISGAHENLMSG